MVHQLSATVGRFGTAYALITPTETDKMAIIEYYLVFNDGGNINIKGGILEVEKILDQTLDSYVQEHINESLPYMVIRMLVDNHSPEELENLNPVKFETDDSTIAQLKSNYSQYAQLILEKSTSDQVKQAFA